TGAGEGLTVADLPSHEEWEQWFPADWVSEMREQIRLWFYSMLFMSVALEGRAPYRRVLSYEKVNDETGRPMHKSWGNAIWFDDDLSNWYVRLSRGRFWRSGNEADSRAAYDTLWYALCQLLRCIAPVMPFLSDEIWQNLVRSACPDAAQSVHLAGYPQVDDGL